MSRVIKLLELIRDILDRDGGATPKEKDVVINDKDSLKVPKLSKSQPLRYQGLQRPTE